MFPEPEEAYHAALAMIDLFAHSGADCFDITITNLQGEKIRFRPNVPCEDVRRKIPASLDHATQLQENVIIRPRATDSSVFFVQLDDLDGDKLAKAQPAAFLAIETSPRNFQAWVAISADGVDEKDLSRRLRKGTGADTTASGATRLAGSHNYKPKYAPDFPQVEIIHSNPGRIVTPEQLAAMQLVAPPENIAPKPKPRRIASNWTPSRPIRFPSYERCLENAPPNHDKTGQDVSRADFTWCMIAIDWGHSVEATAAQLMLESNKAQENGERYALLTAQNAAEAVRRNRERKR